MVKYYYFGVRVRVSAGLGLELGLERQCLQ